MPSGVKASIEVKFGVPSRNASFVSIIIEMYLIFLIGIMNLIFTFAGLHVPFFLLSVPSLLFWVIILTPDLVMRYDSHFRGDAGPLGLFEWYFKLLCRIFGMPSHKTGIR